MVNSATPTPGFGLRPRALGELLDLPFRVFRDRIGTLAAFAVPGWLLLGGLELLVSVVAYGGAGGAAALSESDPFAMLAGALGASLVMAVAVLIVSTIVSTVSIQTARDAVLGERRSVAATWRACRGRVPAALAAAFLLALFGMLVAIAGFVVVFLIAFAFAAAPVLGIALAVPVAAVGLTFGAVVAGTLAPTLPAIVLERRGPLAGIARSLQLVLRRGPRGFDRGANWIRAGVVVLATMLVWQVLALLAQAPTIASQIGSAIALDRVGTAMTAAPLLPLWALVPLTLAGAAIRGLFYPIATLPAACLYLDIRAAHEGIDLDVRLHRLTAPER